MKINLAKLAKILGQLAVAAPTIVAVVKPIIKEARGKTGTDPAADAPAIAGE